MISLIAAIQKKDNAIGRENSLLFSIPADQKRFQSLTMGHPVIMGRKTYDSIPEKYRPLPGRTNIVISRSTAVVLPQEVINASSLQEAILEAQKINNDIFIIGGGQIYAEAIEKNLIDKMELTLIDGDMTGDVFFPDWQGFGTIVATENGLDEKTGLSYSFITITRT